MSNGGEPRINKADGREEQHDDQMLYELLRCIKALSTSEVGTIPARADNKQIGKTALRHRFPSPFPALSLLLFSEKKPGDLACRQIIIELWLSLFDLVPGPSLLPTIRTLLAPDIPDPAAEQHAFITQIHRPRVFKSWVGELSDICRDYFW